MNALKCVTIKTNQMRGTIQVLTDKGEVIAEKSFHCRMVYMALLAELMETFRRHRIEVTFESDL